MNLAKFKAGFETARMLAHWTRQQDENGEYVTYPRSQGGGGHIHQERTQQNYTIGVVRDENWIKERLKNVYQKPNQKSPVQICDIVVTLPRTEPKENTQAFMQAVYDSLTKMYGKYNNVVGAWVHMDEAQPHLHFAFLPISPNKSKQMQQYAERLAVNPYWPKKSSLQQMHRQVQRDVDAALGHHVDVTYTPSKDRDEYNKLTMGQLKTKTKEKRQEFEALEDKKLEKVLARAEHYEGGLLSHEHVEMSEKDYQQLADAARLATTAKNEIDKAERSAEYEGRARQQAEEYHKNVLEKLNDLRDTNNLYLGAPAWAKAEADKQLEANRLWYRDYVHDTNKLAAAYCVYGSPVLATQALAEQLPYVLKRDTPENATKYVLSCAQAAVKQAGGRAPRVTTDRGDWTPPSPSETNYSTPPLRMHLPDDWKTLEKDWQHMNIFDREEQEKKEIRRLV